MQARQEIARRSPGQNAVGWWVGWYGEGYGHQ